MPSPCPPLDAAAPPLLAVDSLCVSFYEAGVTEAPAPVLEGVSFSVAAGEILALVGESGCGKSLTCQALLGLLPSPATVQDGRMLLEGRDLRPLSPKEWQQVRGKAISLIPQDPMTSLNPLLTIGQQLDEVLRLHTSLTKPDRFQRACELLAAVQIANPDERLKDYPHQFSGGMCQRVLIALALASQPKLLLADEPTTALDVTVQAQILALLDDLRRQHDMGVLLITHDLGVVAECSDAVVVMYAGQVVETAPTATLFANPQHPYTQALLASLPKGGKGQRHEKLYSLEGIPPAVSQMPMGCRFLERCPKATTTCQQTASPPLTPVEPQHAVACWLLSVTKESEEG